MDAVNSYSLSSDAAIGCLIWFYIFCFDSMGFSLGRQGRALAKLMDWGSKKSVCPSAYKNCPLSPVAVDAPLDY